MDSIPQFSQPGDVPHTTGVPDELSPCMAAFLDELYATPEELTDFELRELAAREDEHRLSDEITRAIADTRRLSSQLAELGFPARVAV